MKKINIIFCIIAVSVIACTSVEKEGGNTSKDITDQTTSGYSSNMISEIISSVPNPLEMSTILRKSGVVFNEKLLNSVKNVDTYETEISKAINLGIYGTDFVHMNIYKNTEKSIEYLENIKKLVDELGVSDYFYYDEIKELIIKEKSTDSILFLTSFSYDRMNMHFIENNQSSNSVLLSYGTWIESLYLATNIKKVTNTDIVKDRIAEQKNVLDNLYLLLSLFNNQKEFRELLVDLKMLRNEFDKVKIIYQYSPPTTKEINGSLVIIDNSTSNITIDAVTVIEIGKIVSAIRNKMIS